MDVSRSRLVEIIQEWNATRLEMFELSLPDENLEFYGVMRFYYYENDGNIATKCLRVYSTATVSDIVFALLEKLSSIKIVSTNTSYGMCEVHPDGTARLLDMDELPLLLQLTWMKDCIEGRFLLRKSDNFLPQTKKNGSKKLERVPTDDTFLARDLYRKIPETSFTQSIVNPEVVMRRKRHQKLDRKLIQISGVGGAPDKGAPMRIYGTLLNPNIPYKTLLLSYKDTADYVVREMLGKYMMNDQDPDNYVLVELLLPPGVTEYSYDDILQAIPLSKNEIPYIIRSKHNPANGLMLFHVANRDLFKKISNFADPIQSTVKSRDQANIDLPFLKRTLVESDPIFVQVGVTLFGSRAMISSINKDFSFVELPGDDLLGHHAEIHFDGKVATIQPFEKAKLYVNDVPVFDNFVLLHGDSVQFGSSPIFKLYMPGFVEYSAEYAEKDPVPLRPLEDPYQPHTLIPAQVTFRDEDVFLLLRNSLHVSPANVSFKFGPAFFVYLLARGYSYGKDQETAQSFLLNVAASVSETIKKSLDMPTVLAFWISNTVELLQLLIKDSFLRLSSNNILSIFLESCTMGYDELFEIVSRDLEEAMNSFFADVEDADPHSYGRRNVLERTFDVIGSSIFMMQTNKMHSSITLMFFGELFGLLNYQLVKGILSDPKYCCIKWGRRLNDRINLLKSFIVIQGLEQSATIHFQLISEMADFLCILEDGVDFSEINRFSCLNSLHVEYILDNYTFTCRAHMLSYKVKQQIINSFIRDVDSLLIGSDRSVVMLQDVAKLPFSLPGEDFYYESLTEVPHEFVDYVVSIIDNSDLCQLKMNNKPVTLISVPESSILPKSSDSVHYGTEISRQLMAMHLPLHPEIVTLRINKLNGTLGISLASTRSQTDGSQIIIVDSIVKDGAAYLNGKVKPFDQLLVVDSTSMINVSLDKVTQIMMNSSDCVELKISKSGALYHVPYRLIKNVSPKFHSLMDPELSSPPATEIRHRSMSPRRDLEPVILTPIKKSMGSYKPTISYQPRDYSVKDPETMRYSSRYPTEKPTVNPKLDRLSQSSRVPTSQPFNGRSKEEQSRNRNSFLLKLNSVPPRTDSKPKDTEEAVKISPRIENSMEREAVLRHFSRTVPPSSRMNSEKSFPVSARSPTREYSGPQVARVVATIPQVSENRRIPLKTENSLPPEEGKPKTTDLMPLRTIRKYETTESVPKGDQTFEIDRSSVNRPKQVPPARVSSLNHSFFSKELGFKETKPIIKVFEESDSEKKLKSVSFERGNYKNMSPREPTYTEDDYQNVYKSALRDTRVQSQSSLPYDID